MPEEQITLYALRAAVRTADAAALSALAACIAAVVGPIIAYYAAWRQIKATTISANRQRWIDGLREDLAAFTAGVSFLVIAHESKDFQFDHAEYEERLVRLLELKSRIHLRLNPKEQEHEQLLSVLDSFGELLKDLEADGLGNRLVALREQLIRDAQKVLKFEWERVKRGE